MRNGKRLSRSLLLMLMLAVLVRLLSMKPDWVEAYYSNGIYLPLSAALRTLTGIFPFSLGDLLYLILGCLLVFEIIRFLRWVRKPRFDRAVLLSRASAYGKYVLLIYLFFNLLWGLNYDRQGIAAQLNLNLADTVHADLESIVAVLASKVNRYRPAVPATAFYEARVLTENAYSNARMKYPFIRTRPPAMKSSLFGIFGNYFGYSGYYNPFTGEGHVNNEVPAFLVPFVTSHEMAHQAGYARENEANFVGFLAARESQDSTMLYSAYFNMFLYAYGELRFRDSAAARISLEQLRPEVIGDIQVYRDHLRRFQSPLGDWVDRLYSEYLKWNDQPAGLRTYNQVVLWLLAYYRKEGEI